MKDPIFDIVLKVVLDTCEGFQLEIVKLLYQHKEGLSKDELANLLEISPTHTYTILTRDMTPTGVVQFKKVSNDTGRRGRNTDKYTLTDELWSICKKVLK